MNLALSIMMLINTLELGTITTLFCLRLKRRPGFLFRALGCAAAALLYVFLVPLERMPYFAVHVPIVLLAFLYIGLCYYVHLREAVFLGIAAYTVQHISSLLNSIVTFFFPELFFHFVTEGVVVNLPAYALIIGIDVLTFIAAYYLIIRRLDAEVLRKIATVPVIALGASVIVMNQIWVVGIIANSDEYASSVYALMDYIWNLIACLLTLTIEFNLFSLSRKDSELEITKKLIAEKERQYRMTKSSVDAINRKCHDLKYQLAAIRQGGGDSKHVEEAMELVESFDSAIHTGNDTLDIIFTEKNFYCKKHEIAFVCMIEGEKLNFMDLADQYVMFGNIIDNAINAVRQLADHSKRSIYVNIHAEKQLLFIQTENPFVGTLEFSDGLPRTSTGDEFNHGFGMTSIRMIAEKYSGSVNTRAEDGIFYLSVVIPIDRKEETE